MFSSIADFEKLVTTRPEQGFMQFEWSTSTCLIHSSFSWLQSEPWNEMKIKTWFLWLVSSLISELNTKENNNRKGKVRTRSKLKSKKECLEMKRKIKHWAVRRWGETVRESGERARHRTARILARVSFARYMMLCMNRVSFAAARHGCWLAAVLTGRLVPQGTRW